MTSNYEDYVSIEINSADRDKGDIENFTYFLDHQIKFNKSPAKSYFTRLEDILLPKTFYDIDSTNNVFIVLEEDGTATATYNTLSVTIPEGSYTITELLTQLESDLDTNTTNSNAYTLSYDDITNKVTFEFTAGGGTPSSDVIIDTIANGSTLNDPLGFSIVVLSGQTINEDSTTDVAITFVSGTPQEAPYRVDLDTKSYIRIETNITSDSFFTKNNQTHLGALVPINVDRNEKQYYSNHDGRMSRMNNKGAFNLLTFRLLDENNNQLDMNGANYSFNFNIYQMTEIHKM